MTGSLSQLLEDSFQIAWEYLERTGELGDGAAASRFLGDTNRAIAAHQRFRLCAATGSQPAAPSSVIPIVIEAQNQELRNGDNGR
jgi:hypothetical protein